MNIANYLQRINYQGNIAPTLSTLTALQEAHLLVIPFENLDIHYQQPIVLQVEQFYQKIVQDGRGGFCYELNGLFYQLLINLGFEAKMVSARVYDAKKAAFGQEYDHLAILVKLAEQEYLVDVGFGEFAFHPLALEWGTVQEDPRGNYVLESLEGAYYQVTSLTGDSKTIEYRFTLQARILAEFAPMCHYHQTSPQSHFTHKKLISQATPTGRITLTNTSLKFSEKGKPIQETSFLKEAFGQHLLHYFGIEEELLLIHKHSAIPNIKHK